MTTATVEPAKPARTPDSLGKGTLGRQLVTRVLALLVVLASLMGLLSTVWIYATMVENLDEQLTAQVGREFDVGKGPGGKQQYLHVGRPVDSLTVVADANGKVTGVLITDDPSDPVADIQASDLTQILALPRDAKARTLHLSIGTFRVMAASSPPTGPAGPSDPGRSQSRPQFVASALPMDDIHTQIWQIVLAETGLVAAACLASVFILRGLVQQSLRPLRRLSTAARDVAGIELDKGDPNLDVRVPVSGDEVEEVASVATAFNRMLDHVDGALTARHASEQKVRQFVADASHELRNPLASIRGYAEITRRGRDELPADTAFAMGRIEAESERMSALVEDMLLLARLDNAPQLDLADVDLTELVLMSVSDAQVAGPGHRWQLDLAPEPISTRADRNRLQQVVVNLLTNARVHTPAGTVVTASVRAEGDQAVLTIADNGPGIAPQILDSVFERFVRADPSRVRQGRNGSSTGLGLAIAKGVVEAHHGTISVNSAPGDTRFTIRLPLVSH